FARHRLAPASRHAGPRCGHQCSSRRRRGAVSVLVGSIAPGQASGSSIVTLPAAISRNAVTTSLLSDSTSGRAPLSSCLARRAAPSTSSKRLGMFSRQSSTVIRAIRHQLSGAPPLLSTQQLVTPRTQYQDKKGLALSYLARYLRESDCGWSQGRRAIQPTLIKG